MQGVGEYLQRIIRTGLPPPDPGSNPFPASAMDWEPDVFHDASSDLAAPLPADSGRPL